MQSFPHHYAVTAVTSQTSGVSLRSAGLEPIESSPPAEFGGPGDKWSPETLLVAAVADCYLLTFKAVANASGFGWISIESAVEGVLDKQERSIRFTAFTNKVKLVVPPGTDLEAAGRILDKAERSCLIVNSLRAEAHLEADIQVADS